MVALTTFLVPVRCSLAKVSTTAKDGAEHLSARSIRNVEAFVNECLGQLRSDYAGEATDVFCSLKNEDTFLELNYSFTLRRDQIARQYVLKLGSVVSTNQVARLRYLDSAFKLIRGTIDDAIAGVQHPSV